MTYDLKFTFKVLKSARINITITDETGGEMFLRSYLLRDEVPQLLWQGITQNERLLCRCSSSCLLGTLVWHCGQRSFLKRFLPLWSTSSTLRKVEWHPWFLQLIVWKLHALRWASNESRVPFHLHISVSREDGHLILYSKIIPLRALLCVSGNPSWHCLSYGHFFPLLAWKACRHPLQNVCPCLHTTGSLQTL